MKYIMTQEDFDKLLAACKPVPMIMLQCGNPPTVQERANEAWKELGYRMGFKWETVRPCGTNPLEFTADAEE